MFMKRTKERIKELERELEYANKTICAERKEISRLEKIISGEKTCVEGPHCKACEYGIEPSAFEQWMCRKQVVCKEFEKKKLVYER